MAAFRAFLLAHRAAAALLVAVALAIKALVPGGYMVAGGTRTFTVLVCSETQHRQTTMRLVLPVEADHGRDDAQSGKAPATCPFAGLALPALAGADPLQVALALAFIVALACAPAPRRLTAERRRLRPPLRAPPAAA